MTSFSGAVRGVSFADTDYLILASDVKFLRTLFLLVSRMRACTARPLVPAPASVAVVALRTVCQLRFPPSCARSLRPAPYVCTVCNTRGRARALQYVGLGRAILHGLGRAETASHGYIQTWSVRLAE
jgi:hypothetical protein